MASFDPFKFLYSFLGYCEELWKKGIKKLFPKKSSKTSRSQSVRQQPNALQNAGKSIKRSALYRAVSSLFARLSVIPTWIDSSLGQWFRKSKTLKQIGRPLSMVFRVSFLQPLRWLIQIVGAGIQWLTSRKWQSIIFRAVPTISLLFLIFLVWFGGRMNRRVLAEWYRQLGEKEILQWEKEFASGSNSFIDTLLAEEEPEPGAKLAGKAPIISPYSEMLYRRVQLLEPSQISQLIIASTLMQRGAISRGQEILSKLAPDDELRDERAHAMRAYSYLAEFRKTKDVNLIPRFRHHAEGALRWSNTPKEVFVFAADLDWRNGSYDQSLRILQIASEHHPEINMLLFERALLVGQQRLAESARRKGIEHHQRLLKQNPSDERLLVDLALLLGADDDGAVQAESLLTEAQSKRPSPLITRAMSELYRIRFVAYLRDSNDFANGFLYLEKAMVVDPSNPNVAENITAIMKRNFAEDDPIIPALNAMLVSGRATTGTHAMLAEYHLGQNRLPQAIMHLEQVFQVAPKAVKFSSRLAESYLRDGQLELAKTRTEQTLQLLSISNQLNERFVDDLYDTLGQINQKMDSPDKAIENFLMSLNLNPNRAETRRHLASVYRQMGDETNAKLQEKAAEGIEQISRQISEYQQSGIKLTTADSNSSSSDSASVSAENDAL